MSLEKDIGILGVHTEGDKLIFTTDEQNQLIKVVGIAALIWGGLGTLAGWLYWRKK